MSRSSENEPVAALPCMPSVVLVALALAAPASCKWSDPLLTVRDAGAVDVGASSVCSGRAAIDAGGGLSAGLVAWYRCESAGGGSPAFLADSSGRGNDGALASATSNSGGYSFAAGKVGNALDLVLAQKGYVKLPAGLLADACEATIATWVYINSNTNAWTRLWDFGNNTSSYMFLTPITNTDNLARFAISIDGNTHEDAIHGETAVPTLKWTHVALVLGTSGGTLYFDGKPVGTNASMTLRPIDLGSTINNYIGRSQFSDDPYLDGDIDEFRIYNRALSADEVQALANAY